MNPDLLREALVDRLASGGYARSKRVMSVLKKVPRHLFVPDYVASSAYVDSPQPIGFDQTISAPHMVAIMTELLEVKEDSNILEVGTGSGYQAAVFAELAPRGRVVSVERIFELTENARTVLASLGYRNVVTLTSDGTLGCSKYAPYDRIAVTAAAPQVPSALVSQLAPDGVMLIPVGNRWSQTLLMIRKDDKGEVESLDHGGCVFVPLIGEDGW